MLGKKIRIRSCSRLKKKSGAGVAKKFAGSPARSFSSTLFFLLFLVHCLKVLFFSFLVFFKLYCSIVGLEL